MLMRVFPVFFVISICAATFIVSFILFYLHAGPRILVGHPHAFKYFPLIDIESNKLKFIDISESLLNEIVRSQLKSTESTKALDDELDELSKTLAVNRAFLQQHVGNEVSAGTHDYGKKRLPEASQNNSIRRFFNPNRAKHFEMLKPKSVEAMFIDHQRTRKRMKVEFDSNSDGAPKPTPVAAHFEDFFANQNVAHNKEGSDAEWEAEQARRRSRVRLTCENNEHIKHPGLDTLISNRHLLSNFLVDDEHELIYCYVPKVACTQWKRLFITLLGKGSARRPEDIPHMEVHYRSGIPVLGHKQYSDSGIRWRLNSYTKFVFSRHPFERILSAYRDKFESNSTEAQVFSRLYGHAMIRALGDTGRKDYSLSFTDMLRYLSLVPATRHQEHWKPIYNLCHPCTVDYTFIGSFDDLERDSNNIINRSEKIGTKKPKFPNVLQSKTPKLVRKYLAKVPLNVSIQARNVYQMDFDMFGYK